MHSIRADTHTHSHTHIPTHTLRHTHCHCRCCSQVSKTKAHLHSCWAQPIVVAPARLCLPPRPPPSPVLVVGSLWGRMSECWPVFWPCPCFVNVQNLSNFIMLEFAGTSQLPQQQPQHDCTSPLPLILCPPVCCQLLWRLTSAHYKAQESSRTTSSATTSGSAPALPHDSWHFEARHQLVMS